MQPYRSQLQKDAKTTQQTDTQNHSGAILSTFGLRLRDEGMVTGAGAGYRT